MSTTPIFGDLKPDLQSSPVSEQDLEESAASANSSIGHDAPRLQYAIEDVPPWYLCILLGFQHYITMVGATISIPIILAPALCIQNGVISNDVAKAELMGTIFFVSGLSTFLQCTFGSRLPIVQGGTFSFLPPTFAILATFGDCPTLLSEGSNITDFRLNNPNVTEVMMVNSPEHDEAWRSRMRAIQGAICVSSLFQIVIGFSGLIGFLMKFISPLVITPVIALVGLSLFKAAGDMASTQWGISLLTVALLALFSQYLRNISIPCGKYIRSNGCVRAKPYPLFRLFPVILSMLVAYIFSIILTYTNVFPDDRDHPYYTARTDSRLSVLNNANWFRFPYPGQWGLPTVTVAGVFGMLAGVLASMVESVGDYYAAARLSGAPPPTTAAINRGIGMEGIGGVMAGLWGSGNGTTSYSENIGALGVTQVGSRRVIQTGAALMLVLGLITKFCAVFVTIPDPIVGGVYIVMFGIVTAVGLSNLQYVDLNSSRNLFIVGISLLLGLAVPNWIGSNKSLIYTTSPVLDEIIVVLLSTGMFVGGGLAFFLDNTIPGTPKERGLTAWSNEDKVNLTTDELREKYQCYDMPFGNNAIYRAKWTSYIPICPNFLSHRHSPPERSQAPVNTAVELEEQSV